MTTRHWEICPECRRMTLPCVCPPKVESPMLIAFAIAALSTLAWIGVLVWVGILRVG